MPTADEERHKIYLLHTQEGMTVRALAERFNRSHSRIWQAIQAEKARLHTNAGKEADAPEGPSDSPRRPEAGRRKRE